MKYSDLMSTLEESPVYRLKNQKQIDVLAEYLGESASLFEFNSSKATRVECQIKSLGLSRENKTIWLYLDLKDWGKECVAIQMYIQFAKESIIVKKWALADPTSIDAVRKHVAQAIDLLNQHENKDDKTG